MLILFLSLNVGLTARIVENRALGSVFERPVLGALFVFTSKTEKVGDEQDLQEHTGT